MYCTASLARRPGPAWVSSLDLIGCLTGCPDRTLTQSGRSGEDPSTTSPTSPWTEVHVYRWTVATRPSADLESAPAPVAPCPAWRSHASMVDVDFIPRIVRGAPVRDQSVALTAAIVGYSRHAAHSSADL